MEKHSDIKLAEDFRMGDKKAFETVFKRFYRPIMLFAYGLVKDRTEAEDIAVNTMSKLWKIHQNFDTLLNIRAFLYITARNACLNFLEKQKRDYRNAGELEYLFKSKTDDFILSHMIEKEIFELIKQEIDKLSPQRREVLVLAFYQNMSSRDIAEKMNLSYATVRNTRADGIRMLREKLFQKKILAFLLLFVLPLTG